MRGCSLFSGIDSPEEFVRAHAELVSGVRAVGYAMMAVKHGVDTMTVRRWAGRPVGYLPRRLGARAFRAGDARVAMLDGEWFYKAEPCDGF